MVGVGGLELLFIGDVCLPPPPGEAPFAALKEKSPENCVLIANIEGALTGRDRPMPGRYAAFRDAPAAVTQLAGIDVALLANNHTGDFGPEGGEDTVRHLLAAGITPVGYGRLLAETPLVGRLTRTGTTVAFVNACCPTAHPATFATATTAGVAPLCPSMLADAIRESRATADVVVFCPHWGPEMQELPVPEQIALAHWAVEAGADAVIGHHAHVIQSVEFYRGAPVLHGLGNAWFPETGWFGSDESGQPVRRRNRITERERLSLAVTLRVRPERPAGRRLEVAAIRRLRFAAPAPPRPVAVVPEDAAVPAVPLLRRLLAARLLRRLRRGGNLEYHAALRHNRLCCWYASQRGPLGEVLRYEAALWARTRRGGRTS